MNNTTIQKQEILKRLEPALIKDLSLKIKPSSLTPDTLLFGENSLGLDSLDGITITLTLDIQFSIIENPEDIPKEAFHSIGSLVDYIQNHPQTNI